MVTCVNQVCMRLPGGGDELFCARRIPPKKWEVQEARRQGEGGDKSAENGAQNSSSIDDSTSVMVIRCPVGACGPNNTCLQVIVCHAYMQAHGHRCVSTCVVLMSFSDTDTHAHTPAESNGPGLRVLQAGLQHECRRLQRRAVPA